MRSEVGKYRDFLCVVSALILAASMLIAVPCTAQSPAVSVEEPVETDSCLQDPGCAELYTNARSLSQAGQYEAALVAYQSAYVRSKAFWLLVNIGRMQQKTGRPQQAIATYRELLEEAVWDPFDPQMRSKAREYLQQAEQEVQLQQAVLVPPKNTSSARPIYKKWWFWMVVGGATAVVAGGLAIGLTPRSPSAPQGVGVYNTGF
jgi:hypothetical protein